MLKMDICVYHKAHGIIFVLRFDQFFPYFLFTIRKCFGFAFWSKLVFILLFLSCYFVSSNILIRLGFFIINFGMSSNAKFFIFISGIGGSKIGFVRVFLLLKCGVLKRTFSYYLLRYTWFKFLTLSLNFVILYFGCKSQDKSKSGCS